MELEDQVIGIAFALSAALLFFWAVPSFAIRQLRRGAPPPLPAGRVPTRGFGMIDVLGVSLFFAFYALAWVGSRGEAGLAELDEEKMKMLPVLMTLQLVIHAVTIGLVVGFLCWRMNVVEALGVRWKGWPWLFLIGPVGLAIMIVLNLSLELSGYNAWMIDLAGGEARNAQQDVVRLFDETSDPLTLVLMTLMACIGAPFAEEVAFRGYIYPAVKRFAGIPVAVTFSALLFAAVHMNMAVLLPLFLLGVILALVYEFTGSIWAPIVVHFSFNAFGTGIMLLRKIPAVKELMDEGAEKYEAIVRFW